MSVCFVLELVQKASKDDSRDFLFYLAVANYRLKVSVIPKVTTILIDLAKLHLFSFLCGASHIHAKSLTLINVLNILIAVRTFDYII